MKATAQRLNSIGATDVRRARGEVVTENVEVTHETGMRQVLYNVDRVQDYLARYHGQGHISDIQSKAGQRYAKDSENCHIGIRSQLGHTESSGKDMSIKRAGHGDGYWASVAGRRVLLADQALGPLASIVRWVAAEGRSAQDWAINQGKPPRDGIAALRLGLDALAEHYGLTRAATTV